MEVVIQGNASDRHPPAWIVRRAARRLAANVETPERVPRCHGSKSDYLADLSRAELVAHVDGILAGTVQVDTCDLRAATPRAATPPSGHGDGGE